MPLDTLMGGLKAAKLDTGETISPGLARRLACEAGIIPAVLGGTSQVLDLGRKKRFHNEAQRIVKIIETGGCTGPGLRLATRALPHAPPHPLEPGRHHRPRRHPDLPHHTTPEPTTPATP